MEKPLAFIVEDDKHLAAAFSAALEDAGYRTEIIYDGRTAKEHLVAEMPVTVVLDLHIPQIKGPELLKFIRSEPALKSTHVIVTTADDRTAEQVTGLANLILLKPVGYMQLRDLAARYLPRASGGTGRLASENG